MRCPRVALPLRVLFESVKMQASAQMAYPEPLLSEKQLCEWIGIGRATAVRWRHAGLGPRFIHLGARRLAYRKSDVEQWLATREREAGIIVPTEIRSSPSNLHGEG
ncbi:hypothetical protein AMST5_03048 [freshwater sediment metagenome]|uniref:Helix-turn-helix domain-containing protein n=1 Tax=freshwater sediment metagenome TaxID=556182 RepID=A0AA48REA1_9ZZZZ